MRRPMTSKTRSRMRRRVPMAAVDDVLRASIRAKTLHYWRLDETSGARADSKGGWSLTDNNSVGSESSGGITSAVFVGDSTQHLYYASAELSFTAFTVAGWVYATDDPTDDFPVWFSLGTTGSSNRLLVYHTKSVAGRISVDAYSSGGTVTRDYTGYTHNQFNFVAATGVIGGNITVYQNGVSLGSQAAPATGTFSSFSSTFLLGGWSGGGESDFDGKLNRVLFSDQVLSSEELSYLYSLSGYLY